MFWFKAVNVQHHKVGETNEPSIYRINDDLVIWMMLTSQFFLIEKLLWLILTFRFFLKEYSVEIYEWSGTSWEPYVADDVQVQFYMMSPYVLKTLSNDKKVLFNFSWTQS
jgi:oligosaccharyltransferase complex subunit beta